MPLRAMLANPFVLATMTVIAIGIITYQILQNKKRVPIRGYRGIDYGSPGPDKPDESPGKFDKGDDGHGKGKPCNETKSEKSSDASSGVRKRTVATQNADRSKVNNLKVEGRGIDYGPDKPDESPGKFDKGDDGHGKGKPCNETKSEKSSDASSGVRKRTVATQNADRSKVNNLKVEGSESKSHSHSVSSSINENSDLASDCSINRESQYPSQQNSEKQEVENSITPVNSNKTFVANINHEDSDSSESNNLQVPSEETFVADIDSEDSDSDSSESNNSLQNHKSMDLDESICNVASASNTSRSENIRTPSPIDSFEEMYKRDVYNRLKTDIEGENNKEEEKCVKNSSDEESDVSESNFSAVSEESNASCVFVKKPELCKGCLEEIANAVAYPCKHCYLCLDCAVKVHRIFKKCTICFSVIKTFEQLKM